MALKELDNSNINKHLGQSSQYKATYDPSLLVREPRQSNRTHLDLDDDNLPFIGSDTWNAYEVSGLTDNGLPVAGVGKIVYPSDNKYIVESKSFKLYFNSFNGTKLGEDPEEVREKIALKASKDLSDLLETDVKVHVFSNYEVLSDNTTANEEWQSIVSKDKPYNEYITLEDVYPIEEVVFDTYKETPELLKVIEDAPTEWVHYHSAVLKSNCGVT